MKAFVQKSSNKHIQLKEMAITITIIIIEVSKRNEMRKFDAK